LVGKQQEKPSRHKCDAEQDHTKPRLNIATLSLEHVYQTTKIWKNRQSVSKKLNIATLSLEQAYQTTKIWKNRQSVRKKHKLLLKTSRLIFI